MEIIKPGTQIPFTRYRYIAIAISTAVNLAVLILLFTWGPILGVDFAGGSMVHLRFQDRVTIPEIRQALTRSGLADSVIQDFGQDATREFLIRLEKTSAELGVLGEQVRK